MSDPVIEAVFEAKRLLDEATDMAIKMTDQKPRNVDMSTVALVLSIGIGRAMVHIDKALEVRTK